MQDAFTGQPTVIQGRRLPGPEARACLQDDHERRLEALARLGAAAEKCDLRAHSDPDRDLVLLAEDEVALLEHSGPEWAELGAAIRDFRVRLPLHRLEDFGFHADVEHPLEEPNARLNYLHSGVEASAFMAVADSSVYKFFLPRDGHFIGSEFGFRKGEETVLYAEAVLGGYRALFEKLLLVQALGGMATEVVAVTPEGIVVAKQTLGEPLPQGADTSEFLPAGLIEIPSRFLRANRDHPRLFFIGERAWLVADLHARNLVRAADGQLHVIDLVAAPWPADLAAKDSSMAAWLERVRHDPEASALPGAHDDDL
ncbi:MAG: hypothetical protein B9S34_00290 [Opitutia bacterium Tous-C1TDCM]|nr:MAG: hypothetical protein B9S34_00290 [Opitutae bacterium Tous-C1TDCM]